MENLRKRFEREKVETIKFGSINLARDILSPGDKVNVENSMNPKQNFTDFTKLRYSLLMI